MKSFNIDERGEQAVLNFMEGYNCAQSVFLAYADLFDLDKELAKKMSVSKTRARRTMPWCRRWPACSGRSITPSSAESCWRRNRPRRQIQPPLLARRSITPNVPAHASWPMRPVWQDGCSTKKFDQRSPSKSMATVVPSPKREVICTEAPYLRKMRRLRLNPIPRPAYAWALLAR